MPGPAAFVFGPGAVAAAKHMAWHIATSVDLATVTSATLAVLCLRFVYRALPAWVKEDISFQHLLRNGCDNGSTSKDGLSIQHLVEKMQELSRSLESMDHDLTQIPHLHSAVLAFIQLSAQLKLQQASSAPDKKAIFQCDPREQDLLVEEKKDVDCNGDDDNDDEIDQASPIVGTTIRDSIYDNAGDEVEISKLRSEELRHALDLATWSYHEDSHDLERKLVAAGYAMLRHHLNIRPGTVAHFIAVHPPSRKVIVSLRGTSSLEDLLTDCMGRAVPLLDDLSVDIDAVRVEVKAAVPNLVMADSTDEIVEIVSGHERIVLEDDDDDGDRYVRCHEGMLTAARNVLNEIGPFLRDYVKHCDYQIVFCGHSLGAGTAIIAAALMRSKYPELCFLGHDDSDSSGIQVFAFAPPPVLDHDSAIAASSYCTSIVNGADVIPRCSISNLLVLMAVLAKVQSRLVEHDMCPTDPIRTIKFVNKLAEGVSGTPLLTVSEFHQLIQDAQRDITLRKPQHLFIPGRVLLAYNPWLCDDKSFRRVNSWCSDPLGDLTGSSMKSWKCVQTTGTNAVFQSLEIDGLRCFTDHLTSSYYEALGMEYSF